MNDKELLEMAAKAAGLEFSDGRQLNPKVYLVREIGSKSLEEWRGWNPLTNDGDALRLAVKLGFGMTLFTPRDAMRSICMVEIWREDNDGDPIHVEWYKAGDDPYAATRRAIVRAAAEIGKGQS